MKERAAEWWTAGTQKYQRKGAIGVHVLQIDKCYLNERAVVEHMQIVEAWLLTRRWAELKVVGGHKHCLGHGTAEM